MGAMRGFASVLGLSVSTALLASCSLIVDTTADQCTTTADCLAHGGDFAATVCGTQKTCVSLLSEDCKTIVQSPGDLAKNPVILGILMPQTGQNAPSMVPRVNAIKMARDEISEKAGGIPAPGGGPSRPLVFISCDDAVDANRAACHLAEVVRVPAIIGPAFSGVTTGVATQVTIPGGTLIISPSATSPTLSDLADNGLVWRTAPSDVFQAVGIAALVESNVEERVRSRYMITAPARIKVMVAFKGDAYGFGLKSALYAPLRFNGESAADNTTDYAEVDYGDPQKLTPDQLKQKYAAAVAAIAAFKPHILITVGTTEGVEDIVTKVESGWTGATYKPFHIVADGLQVPELLALVAKDTTGDLRGRVLGTIGGVDPSSSAPSAANYKLFDQAYKTAFGTSTLADTYAAGAYDATYLLAFAAAGAGTAVLTGEIVNQQLKRTARASPEINARPNDFGAGAAAMRAQGMNFNGASGPLDFDPVRGEAEADIQIWCITVDAMGKHTFRNSGLYKPAGQKALVGTLACTF